MYNSSLERSCSKGFKTGFIFIVGPILSRHEIFPEFRNFDDLRGHSRGNPRSGLIFMGGGGVYHIVSAS